MKYTDSLKKRELNFWLNIVSPIITIAFTVGMYITTINNQSDKIKKLEADLIAHQQWGEVKHEAIDKTMLTIQVQLAEIQKDILYIKEKVR